MTETLTWDVSSNLVSTVVDDGTDSTTWTYLYDASGQRWAKIETPTKTGETPQATVYLGDTEITDDNTTVNDATSDVTAVRYFTFGGATVAMVRAVEVEPFEPSDEVPFFFLFGDYQGSAQVVMPDVRVAGPDSAYDLAASAGEVLRNAYTPYGATRAVGFGPGAATEADAQFERGWLSQVADETTTSLGTGLTYLNARYYDPVSSRFLSPDPLLDVMDPKTLDPYRYADNNPIVFADASGMAPSCGGFWDGVRIAGSGTDCSQGILYGVGAFFRGRSDGYTNSWGGVVHSFSWTGMRETAKSLESPVGALQFANGVIASQPTNPVGVVNRQFLQALNTADQFSTIMAAQDDPGLGLAYGSGLVVGEVEADTHREALVAATVVAGPGIGSVLRGAASRISNFVSKLPKGKPNLPRPGPATSPKRWSVGDDVYSLTAAGNKPAWSTVRSRFWKNEAASPQYGPWSPGQASRMERGLAPQRYSPDKRGLESMELSHEPTPIRHGGTTFVPRWPQDHAAYDSYRRPGY